MALACLAGNGETIYIIGNSLARHEPRPDIGWNFNHGMAATEPEKDYAHILRRNVSGLIGREAKLEISRMNMEANMAGLPVSMPDEVDIVILQVGDNYKGKLTPDDFKKRYGGMLKSLKGKYPDAVLIAVSDWRSGPTALMQEAAGDNNVPWVSIKAIGKDSEMSAAVEKKFTAWAVNWHPGDAGMAAIAGEIWKTLKPLLEKRPAKKDITGTTGIIPEPQEVTLLETAPLTIDSSLKLFAPADCPEIIKTGIASFLLDFKAFYGFEPEVSYTLDGTALILAKVEKTAHPEIPAKGYDAYALKVSGEGAVLVSGSAAGLFYGIQTLRQLLRSEKSLPAVSIRDWADQKWRMVYSPAYDPQWIIPKLARMKVNMCIMESAWNASGNWWFNPNAANRAKAEEFIRVARQYNIEVIPLIQGGGWSYGVIDQNPNCAEGIWVPDEKMVLTGEVTEFAKRNLIRTPSMPVIVTSPDGKIEYTEGKDYEIIAGVTVRPFKDDNKPWQLKRLAGGRLKPGIEVKADYNYMNYSPHQTPYCPAEPLVYKILDWTLSNSIKIYQPKYIHIGHDEVIYRERCRRCHQSGKTNLELMTADLKFWYDKIKSQDPEITVLIWDDLLRRESRDGGALLETLPRDVIICPWVYQGNAEAMTRIEDRLKWFLAEKKRPVIGTASGYFHENNILWRNALRPYRNDPNNLGFMFSHWGESLKIWGTFPTAAELMWSADKPDDARLKATYTADYAFSRLTGWRAALEYGQQRGDLAKKVNRGDNDLEQIRAAAEQLISSITRSRLQGFDNTDGVFPEQTASQMRHLVEWYRAMLIYRDLTVRYDATKMNELFTALKLAAPLEKESWNQFAQDKVPVSDDLFGVEIKPPVPGNGQTDFYPLRTFRKVIDDPGIRVIELNGAYTIGGIELTKVEPGMYKVFTSHSGSEWKFQAEMIIGDSGKGIAHWTPVAADRVRIISNEPKEKIKAEVSFFAAKKKITRSEFKTVMDSFINSHGELAGWATEAVVSLADDKLRIDFKCMFEPGRKLIARGGALYEDDCVEFFLKDSTDKDRFLQFVVNCEGKTAVVPHSCPDPLPQIQAEVKIAAGQWSGTILIPASELRGKPESWAMNFTRNQPGIELASWIDLPKAAFWFLQPDSFAAIKR